MTVWQDNSFSLVACTLLRKPDHLAYNLSQHSAGSCHYFGRYAPLVPQSLIRSNPCVWCPVRLSWVTDLNSSPASILTPSLSSTNSDATRLSGNFRKLSYGYLYVLLLHRKKNWYDMMINLMKFSINSALIRRISIWYVRNGKNDISVISFLH